MVCIAWPMFFFIYFEKINFLRIKLPLLLCKEKTFFLKKHNINIDEKMCITIIQLKYQKKPRIPASSKHNQKK